MEGVGGKERGNNRRNGSKNMVRRKDEQNEYMFPRHFSPRNFQTPDPPLTIWNMFQCQKRSLELCSLIWCTLFYIALCPFLVKIIFSVYLSYKVYFSFESDKRNMRFENVCFSIVNRKIRLVNIHENNM